MSKPSLHEFKRDLAKQPPRLVSAGKLDSNFKKLTMLPGRILASGRPEYQVEFKDGGTQLLNLRGLPDGAVAREFTVCDNGQPKVYWFLTWEQEPEV
jgi:hypothetical protein